MPRLDRLLLRAFEPCTVFVAPTDDVAGRRNVLLEISAHVLGRHWSLEYMLGFFDCINVSYGDLGYLLEYYFSPSL